MQEKNSLIYDIPKKVYEDVEKYCKLNNIDDIGDFMFKCFKQGFDIEKYGLLGDDSGKTGGVQEKRVEIEVIREKRVEVPVEVEKIVEKIIEKPVVEYVDREVIKTEYITDDSKTNELLLKIQQLEIEIKNKEDETNNLKLQLDPIPKQEAKPDKSNLLQETIQKLKKQNIDLEIELKELKEKFKNFESFDNEKKVVYHRGSDINKNLIK
jgi:hypothetical protein